MFSDISKIGMKSPTKGIVDHKKQKHGLLRRMINGRRTRWVKERDTVGAPEFNSSDGYVIINSQSTIVCIYGDELQCLVGKNMNSLNGVDITDASPTSIDSASALVFIELLRKLWTEYKKQKGPVGLRCNIQSGRNYLLICTPVNKGALIHAKTVTSSSIV